MVSDCTIELGALEGISLAVRAPEADSIERWHSQLQGVPGLRLLGGGDLTTDQGWPCRIVRADVGDEQRLYAMFRFDESSIEVVVSGPDLDDRREELLQLLRGARPRYDTRVVALAQVWGDVLEETS